MKKFFTKVLVVFMASGLLFSQTRASSLINPSAIQPDKAAVKSALASYNSLTKSEKREKLREAKKVFKEYKAAKKAHKAPAANSLLQIIFAILIPPLGVYLHEGVINNKFWIDLILTLLFFIPGMIYALIVVLGDK